MILGSKDEGKGSNTEQYKTSIHVHDSVPLKLHIDMSEQNDQTLVDWMSMAYACINGHDMRMIMLLMTYDAM
eukprot:1160865-Pelagomonas_calceolata.AAC.8